VLIEVRLPDIGDFKDVPVIEVLVKPGDIVKMGQCLVTLESDKATMDVPSPVAGTVVEVVAGVGDKVSTGTLVARVCSLMSEIGKGIAHAEAEAPTGPPLGRVPFATKGREIRIPDIGDFRDVPVIEVLVKRGDVVEVEQALITLESDKATMDLPAPKDGMIGELFVRVGDKVSEGSLIGIYAENVSSPFVASTGAAVGPAGGVAAQPYVPGNFSVFVSYRHEDSPDIAARVHDRIRKRLGRKRLFFDIDTIQPGVDFIDYIFEKVSACAALVVIIGKHWNVKRLEEPHDFVRIEVETALKCNCRVIPVLVGGAVMPTAESLPEALKPLARRHAVKIASYASFDSDIRKLLTALPGDR
jgi:pyruvate/2-oxoglutarate dehydrogenase complex dihydrolipoamide acyltransferase (E2) component